MDDPIIKLNKSNNKGLTFTISNVDVCIANGLRRIIMTEIPVIGFDKKKCVIETNTTQFINEILEHRLTCIPVMLEHFEDEKIEDILPNKYTMELNVENTDKEEILITTKDFQLININTGNKVSKTETDKIFPKNAITGDNIIFTRLRPQLTDSIPGQIIKLKCGFSVMTAKQDYVYNVASKCTYFNSINDKEAKEAWESHKIDYLKQFEGKTKADINDELAFEKKNFDALEAYRHFKKNSFDFTLKSVSVYSEYSLIVKCCTIIINKLKNFINNIFKIVDDDDDNNENLVEIKMSKDVVEYPSTMEHSFDIILHNEDYTLGHILQNFMYNIFYIDKKIIFCGFKKFHPHDNYSVLRIAYVKQTANDILLENLKFASNKAIDVLNKIQRAFNR